MTNRPTRKHWPEQLNVDDFDGLFECDGHTGLTFETAKRVACYHRPISVMLRRAFGVVAIEPLPQCTVATAELFFDTYLEWSPDLSDGVPDLILAKCSTTDARLANVLDVEVLRDYGLQVTFAGRIRLNGHNARRGPRHVRTLCDHTDLISDLRLRQIERFAA